MTKYGGQYPHKLNTLVSYIIERGVDISSRGERNRVFSWIFKNWNQILNFGIGLETDSTGTKNFEPGTGLDQGWYDFGYSISESSSFFLPRENRERRQLRKVENPYLKPNSWKPSYKAKLNTQ